VFLVNDKTVLFLANISLHIGDNADNIEAVSSKGVPKGGKVGKFGFEEKSDSAVHQLEVEIAYKDFIKVEVDVVLPVIHLKCRGRRYPLVHFHHALFGRANSDAYQFAIE
jgi:hypothetical protein